MDRLSSAWSGTVHNSKYVHRAPVSALGLRGAAARRSATSALGLVGLGPHHIFAAVKRQRR
jgi:hypothetical protein